MGFMDNVMGSFNDEAGKINTGTGQYRVMQVVLREKFVGKGSKNFAEIEELCNQQYAEGYRLHTFAQSRRDPPASAAAIEPCAISCSSA